MGTAGRAGVFEPTKGVSGESGNSVDSVDFGDSGESGDSGDWELWGKVGTGQWWVAGGVCSYGWVV